MKVSLETKVNFKQGFKELKEFSKYVNKVIGESTSIGYSTDQLHMQDGRAEAIDMAYLATILHEGTDDGRIPPRPFLRATLQQLTSGSKNKTLKTPFEKYFKNVSNGQYSIDQLLLDLGDIVRKEVQKNFGADNTIGLKSNAPSTINKKVGNNPLVESGDLKKAMQVKTSRGGES